MAQTNDIKFRLMFEAGDKNAFNGLKRDLQQLKALASDITLDQDRDQLKGIFDSATAVEQAMNRAFDPKLNTINIQKFNNELKKSGTDIKTIQNNFAEAGAQGQAAFLKMTSQLMQMNPIIRQTNKFLDGIGQSLFNTIKYTAFNALLHSISSSIQKSYYYVKDLDRSLNDIRIVTEKSAEDMADFAKEANNAAKALAVTTEDYTKGSLIYYQQGLDDETVKTLTDITAKASNVTQQSMGTVSEELTAVQNGYQVANRAAEEGMQVYEEYVDKMAAVGASTASNLEELSTAMSKVASAASSMGVGFDDLNAQIATIVSVTRQAPESVGTALKTIYARLGDLKVDGVDEFGTKLGDVSKQLKTMGIDIVDQNDNMRDMSDVIAEVAQKWQTQTGAQKEAAAVAMAGKRQYNNLVALFDNQDMYGEALETSMNAAGTLEKQQEIAMESLANKMDVLKATAEDLYDSLFNTNTIGNFIDIGTNILEFFTNFTDSVGGLNNILPTLAFSLTQLFSKQIATGAETIAANIMNIGAAEKIAKQNAEELRLIYANSSLQGAENQQGRVGLAFQEAFNQMRNYYTEMQQYQGIMTEKEEQQYKLILDEITATGEKKVQLAELSRNLEGIYNQYGLISKELFNNLDNTESQANETKKINGLIKELERAYSLLQQGSLERQTLPNTENASQTPNQISNLDNYLDKLEIAFNLTKDQNVALDRFLRSMGDGVANEAKALENLISQLRQTGANADAITRITTEIQSATHATETLGETLEKTLNFRQNIQNIIKATAAIGQLGFAINSVKNIANIFEDDTTDGQTKFAQVAMNTGFVFSNLKGAIGPLTKMIQDFGSTIGKVGNILNNSNTLFELNAKLIKQTEIATEAKTAAEQADIVAMETKKAAEEATIAAQETRIIAEEKQTALENHRAVVQQINSELIYKGKQKEITSLAELVLSRKANIASMDEESAKQYIYSLNAIKNRKDRKKITEAIYNEIMARSIYGEAIEADIVATTKEQIAKDATTTAIGAEATAKELNAAATAEQSAVTEIDTAIQEENNRVHLSKITILTGVAGAIAILVATIVAASLVIKNIELKRAEAARKARQEEQKLYEEQRENKRKEIEDNQKLLNSYSELYDNYKKGISSKEDLAEKTKDLVELLGEESVAAANLTENYKALNEEARKLNKKETLNKYYQNQEDINKNKENLFGMEMNPFSGSFTVFKEDFDNFQSKFASDNDVLSYHGESVDFILDYEKLTSDQLQEIVTYLYKNNQIKDNDFSQAIQYLANIKTAEQDNQIVGIEKNLHIQENDNLKTYEDYNNILTDTIAELEKTKVYGKNVVDYSTRLEKAIDLINITSIGNERYTQRALATGTLVNKYGEENQEDINNVLAKLSSSEIKSLLSINEATDQNDLKNNLEYYLTLSAHKYTDEVAKETYTTSGDILSKVQSGKITSENATEDEDYQKLVNNLEIIKKAYPEINSEVEIVNKTQLIGTQQYNEALEKVQDKLYELSMNKAVEDINKKITDAVEQLNKIDIKDPESIQAFKDSLDEILNAQYEIDVQIHTEADQEFTNLSNAFDNLDKAAAKIGENFIVAADDIRELNNAFPGIVEGLEYLKDGTVKLNKDIVNSAMAAAEAEAKADAEATVAKLKNQADLLRAKQKIYEKLANAALTLAKGEAATEKESSDARAEMSAELENLKELNSQESANSQMNNAKEVADNSLINAEITGTNQRSAFEQMAEASFQAATAAIQNMQAVANGGGPLAGKENVNKVQYTGSSGLSGDATIIGATQNLLESGGDQDWAEIAEKYAQMADAAGEAANDIDGMIMQIGAKSIALDRDLGSIAKGKGKVENSKSSSSKDKDKDQKEQEDEFDRYQEIKKAIEAVDNALKKLDKDQENLYGYELIASLKQENELLEQQAANYNTLYEMQQQEATELREQLGTMGLMFDASGAITNYAAATSAALQQYAAAIEQYNAGLMDETTFKVYEKSYENFKKLLDRYDKLYYTEMQQTQEKLDEIRRKELANNLKAQEVEIQIHLDKEKMKRDWNDFLKDIKQDFRKVFSDLTIDVKYDEKNFKSFVNDVGTTIKAINDVEAEIDKMMNGGSSTMFESVSQAQEKLKDLQEKLLEQGKSLHDLYKQVWDAYLKGMDQVKEKFDELMKRYEHFNNQLEYHRQLIELIYGDKAYDLMDKYYDAQTKNINAQIDSLKKQADMQQTEFQKSYDTAIKAGSKVDINDFTTQTEDMKKAYENMIESQEKLNDLVVEGVKVLQDKYLNTINKIIDTMDKGIQGKDGFEGMKSNWEFMQKMADEYLDDVEGAAQIQTFANKMDMDKANANSLKAQQKIQAFREKEIQTLREKENLTQADIDLAEARYQIMLKEIALEDAQNNKTSMKLTRNEQGNWSYQYVADEDEVGQKEQDLLQSYSDLYKLADDSYNHSMELAFDLYEEYVEKQREIAEDTTLTEEERLQKQQELYDQYYPQFVAAAQNAELYKQEAMWASAGVFQTVCDQDATAYDTLTEEQKRLVDELKDKNFEDYDAMRTALIEEFYPDLNRIAEEVFSDLNINSQTTAASVVKQQATDPGSVKNEINKAVDAMQKAIQDYEKELDKLQEIAGINFSQVGNYIDQVAQKIDNMNGTTEKMVNDSSNYLDELRRVLEGIADKQNSVIEQILNAQQAMQEYLNLAAQARAASNIPNYGGGDRGGSLPEANGPGSKKETPGSKKRARDDGYDQYHDPNGASYTIGITKDGSLVQIIGGIDSYFNGNYEAAADAQAKQKGYEGFKTGGYTGQQNSSDGRLAMLHQKELVLNADDTENFLSGIKMIRDMSSLNGSITNAITSAVANMVLSLSRTSAGTGTSPISHEANAAPNVFNITAEFPNANDVNEIREAILSLPNLASQYIGKNLR